MKLADYADLDEDGFGSDVELAVSSLDCLGVDGVTDNNDDCDDEDVGGGGSTVAHDYLKHVAAMSSGIGPVILWTPDCDIGPIRPPHPPTPGSLGGPDRPRVGVAFPKKTLFLQRFENTAPAIKTEAMAPHKCVTVVFSQKSYF